MVFPYRKHGFSRLTKQRQSNNLPRSSQKNLVGIKLLKTRQLLKMQQTRVGDSDVSEVKTLQTGAAQD
jgi:hypothetical protein